MLNPRKMRKSRLAPILEPKIPMSMAMFFVMDPPRALESGTLAKQRGTGASGIAAKDLAAVIEGDINVGRLSGGSWLKQIDMEHAYGVTRITVRQALERLAERGQVELIPNRGYRVKSFDAERFNNIVAIRAILEVAAVQLTTAPPSPESLERLRDAAQRFADAVAHGTSAQREEANRAFHREMLSTCPNRELVELIFDLRDRIPMSVQLERYNTKMLITSARDHFEMIELMRRLDSEALSALVKTHTLGALLPEDRPA